MISTELFATEPHAQTLIMNLSNLQGRIQNKFKCFKGRLGYSKKVGRMVRFWDLVLADA